MPEPLWLTVPENAERQPYASASPSPHHHPPSPCPSRQGNMAKQLPAHLSHKSVLALLPPASMIAPIEAVRRVHDKHFARWPPHINLLYPFLSSPSETIEQGAESSPQLKQDIRMRIQEATKHIQPFHVSLSANPPGTFSHSQRSKTVWLGPTTQLIQDLQAALQVEFTECNADQRPYTPHLSIGQARSEYNADLLGKEIQKSVSDFLIERKEGATIALDWYVDKVFVIERKGYRDRFQVIGTIELGKE